MRRSFNSQAAPNSSYPDFSSLIAGNSRTCKGEKSGMERELTAQDIEQVVTEFIESFDRPREERTISVDIDDTVLSITAYFDAMLCEEGDNVSTPYFSQYDDVTVTITEYRWYNEDDEEFTISLADLTMIEQRLTQRL